MSEGGYRVSQEDDASPEDVKTVWDGLADYNRQFVSDGNYKTLRLFIRDAEGNVAGGLLAESFWGWLHLDIFWLREDLRRAGHGSELLTMAGWDAG